jgi:MoaA/NifB/PqqE/SkfB family radical SAM enzyme
LPRFAQIEPVGQCNLRCRMCPISERPDNQRGSPPAFIDEALFRRLVDGLPELEELHLQGMGEPLMHPRFFHLVRYAVGKGIRVSTNTNLTLLTPLRAHLAVASGLAALNASIDGATADTYQYIRRGANFDKVLRNLERLMASREAMNTGTPEVSIVTVVMRRNLGELARIVGLAWEHGVRRVFVQHLCHDYGEHSLPPEYRSMRDFVIGESLLGENPARVADNFAEARHAAAELGVELRLPPLAPGETRRSPRHPLGCEWPYRGAYLSYSGQAMPCCMVSTPDRANLGDMAREGIAAVWNGPEYRAFRAALASDKPPEVCRGCAIYKGTF